MEECECVSLFILSGDVFGHLNYNSFKTSDDEGNIETLCYYTATTSATAAATTSAMAAATTSATAAATTSATAAATTSATATPAR